MLRNPSLLQPMNIFILSLAVSDLMIGLFGSLVVTITNYQGSFFIGHAACIFQGFAVNYFGECRAPLLRIDPPFVSACSLTSCFTPNNLVWQLDNLGNNFSVVEKKCHCSQLKMYKTERVDVFFFRREISKVSVSSSPRVSSELS